MRQSDRVVRALLLLALAPAAPGCDSSDPMTGGVTQVRIEPDLLEFPATPVGVSVEQEITIFSDGEQPLRVSRVELSPPQKEFDIVTELTIPFVLEGGYEKNVRVSYTPQELGRNPSTTMIIECNDKKLPRIEIPISVIEYRPHLKREPTILTWGADDPRPSNLACQETIGRKSITVSNDGSGSLQIRGYTLVKKELPEGEVAQDHFSICPPAGYENRPLVRDQQIWEVVFHPTTAGVKKATLTIQSNGGEATVELIGGGEARSSMEVSTYVLSWPELQQHQSGVKNLDLINTGQLPIDVMAIMVTDVRKRQFYSLSGATFVQGEDRASGRLSQSIPKNGSARIEVTYQASQPVPVQTTLEIHHSADSPPSPVVVQLLGNATAPQLVVDPMLVLFSGVALGVSEQRSLVLRNAGNADLEVARIEIGPDGVALGAENFSCHPAPCSATLAPSEFKTFQIVYHRPLEAMQLEDRGCANVFSNDPDQQPSTCVSLLARNLEGNLPPSACIRTEPENPTVDVGTQITLSCDCSTDPDEGQTISRCDWLLADWPAASRARLGLTGGDTSTPTSLTPDVAGRYRVVLVVTDSSETAFVSPEEDIEIVAR